MFENDNVNKVRATEILAILFFAIVVAMIPFFFSANAGANREWDAKVSIIEEEVQVVRVGYPKVTSPDEEIVVVYSNDQKTR